MHTLDMQIVIREALFNVIDVFFRDFDVAGVNRVPLTGPVILCCAPHANQFVDPMVVLKALSHRKDIGFLTAAKSMRRGSSDGWLGL